MCGTFDAVDIQREQMLDSTQTEAGLHQLFFDRIPKVYEEMNLSIWKSLGKAAWNGANEKRRCFWFFVRPLKLLLEKQLHLKQGIGILPLRQKQI